MWRENIHKIYSGTVKVEESGTVAATSDIAELLHLPSPRSQSKEYGKCRTTVARKRCSQTWLCRNSPPVSNAVSQTQVPNPYSGGTDVLRLRTWHTLEPLIPPWLTNLPGQWLRCRANGSNVCRVLGLRRVQPVSRAQTIASLISRRASNKGTESEKVVSPKRQTGCSYTLKHQPWALNPRT